MANNKSSYKDTMDSIHAPADLVKQTLERMNTLLNAQDGTAKASSRKKKKHGKHASSQTSRRVILVVAGLAACIMLFVGMYERFPRIFLVSKNGDIPVLPVATNSGEIDIVIPDAGSDEFSSGIPDHRHVWGHATCTTPQKCSICGETLGVALGHMWMEATPERPKTCVRCGITQGTGLNGTKPTTSVTDAPNLSRFCTIKNETRAIIWEVYLFPDDLAEIGECRINSIHESESSKIKFSSYELQSADTFTLRILHQGLNIDFKGLQLMDLLDKTITVYLDEERQVRLKITAM